MTKPGHSDWCEVLSDDAAGDHGGITIRAPWLNVTDAI